MIRIVTLAATAALALAAPASAQTLGSPARDGTVSIRIPTAGKSPEQVNAEVVAAATTLCRDAVAGATFPNYEMTACMKATVARTYAQAKMTTATKVAQR